MNGIYVSSDYILFVQNFCDTELHKHLVNHLTITQTGMMNCVLSF